jgi:hypothetical protein
LQRIRKLDSFNQKQFSVGRITKAQMHSLTEAAFFHAFRSYEAFLRNVFLLYCSGKDTGRRGRVKSFLTPCSLKRTELILKSSKRFLEWNSPDELSKRSEIYLKDGFPIKDAIASELVDLRHLKKIRNHVAHMSPESQAEFNEVLKAHSGTVPPIQPSPGEFLLLLKPSTTAYYLLYYIDLMERVSSSMC